MKKLLYLIIFFPILQPPLNAETVEKDIIFKKLAEKLSTVDTGLKNRTVAVYGFDMIGRKDDSYSRYATEKLTHELVEAGKLLIIERSRIDRILNEQQLKMAGIIDAGIAAKIGKILSVDGVIIGSIAVNDNEVEMIARVIQSETAVILKSADFTYKTGDIKANASVADVGSGNKQNEDSQSADINKANGLNPGILLQGKVFNAYKNITVSYSGLPGNKYDWITIVEAGTPDNVYGQWTYTYGNKEGKYMFKGVKPGIYEIRIYYDWPAGGYVVQGRVKLTVK